jgi:sialic acid synthase SpsE
MKAGDVIAEHMFELRRPEAGVTMIEFGSLIGKRVKVDISKDQPLQAEHV